MSNWLLLFVWAFSQCGTSFFFFLLDCVPYLLALKTEMRSMFPSLYCAEASSLSVEAFSSGVLSWMVLIDEEEDIRHLFRACDVNCAFFVVSFRVWRL